MKLGEVDIENLHEIYIFANAFCKLASLPFRFKEDSGHFETAIIINELGHSRIPNQNDDWQSIQNYPHNPQLFVPDLIDYEYKIMMEFEEEGGKKRSGAKLATKGHGREGDITNKRDTKRNEYYLVGGFSLLRIWESQMKTPTIWKMIVIQFLLNCFKKIK